MGLAIPAEARKALESVATIVADLRAIRTSLERLVELEERGRTTPA